MSKSIKELLENLEEDKWRREISFNKDIEDANNIIFSNKNSDESIASTLNTWIAEFQPCVFGRVAAKLGLLSYCILTESDLRQSDTYIRDKIQSARKQWTRDGLEGTKSGFIIMAVSEKISTAIPDSSVKDIAKRLCSLYLLQEIDCDEIYLDELRLKIPSRNETAFRWDVGVNYFCAQGDKRWWHDHRIPGGMAFSMNSVGHMVKSAKLSNVMQELEKEMNISDDWERGSIDSLDKALIFAMKTIDNSAKTISGKATELLPAETLVSGQDLVQCPFDLSTKFPNKNYCEYRGFYHTDQTLPSQYFLSNVERPLNIEPYLLDFTYLFDKQLDNFDYVNMGEGRQIQADEIASSNELTKQERILKRKRAAETIED